MKKILILGSCVTRDMFELLDKSKYQLVEYFARSSIISIYSDKQVNFEISKIESEFQKKIVGYDLNKYFKEFISNNNFDFIIYDLIDERFDLVEFEDKSIVTLSNEFNSIFNRENFKFKIIKSGTNEFYSLYENAWIRFIKQLKEVGKLHKLLINNAMWAEKFDNRFTSNFSIEHIKERNDFLNKIYSRIKQDISNDNFLVPTDFIFNGDPKHKWGVSPFHYTKKYYEIVADRLINIQKGVDVYKNTVFLGVTRFSIFSHGSNAWNLSKFEKDKYFNELYQEERMNIRFDIFFNKSLPIYEKWANKYNYLHVIFYSIIMPKKYTDELKRYSEKYSFIVLQEVDENGVPEVNYKELLKNYDDVNLTVFRVDDDDILSLDYLDKLSKYSNYFGMIISFGYGLSAYYNGKEYTEFRECHHRFLALGMAFIGKYSKHNNKVFLPRGGNHVEIDRFSPVIIDSTEPMFIWTQHKQQDTKVSYEDKSYKISDVLDKNELISNNLNYSLKFPTLEEEINKVNNSQLICNYEQYNVDKNKEEFMILNHKSSNIFVVKIDFTLLNDFTQLSTEDMKRAFIASFKFSSETNLLGLVWSSSKDIGWYSYIGIHDAKLSFKLSIRTDSLVTMESMTLIKNKFKGNIKINKFTILAI